MMKKTVSLLISIAMLLCMLAGCSTSGGGGENPSDTNPSSSASTPENDPSGSLQTPETKDEYKVGILLTNLTNDVWIDMISAAESYGAEKYNATITAVAYSEDLGKFVTEMENFINSGYDAIIFYPPVEDFTHEVLDEAREAGVVTIAYSFRCDQSTFEYYDDPSACGHKLGEMAAAWVEAHDSLKTKDEVKAGMFGYSVIEGVKQRTDAIEEALTAACPNVRFVIEEDAIDPSAGFSGAENMLQAYPDLDLILSFGDGPGVGANEACAAAGMPEDFGIFTIDGSETATHIMATGGYIRGCVNLGGGKYQAEVMIDSIFDAINGTGNRDHMISGATDPICYDNLQEMINTLGYDIPEITVDCSALSYYSEG
ncbi:MAG: sugar ABC transporter substrate-binding protein [Oscillospiraceae bacterium]|nr:sugar ABC transporter substrate-binding protein [Oscillospiraceae bacterium]